MTSPKQDKRPNTLIEYMGLKDPDLFLPNHDKWCLNYIIIKNYVEQFQSFSFEDILEMEKEIEEK